MLRRLAPTARLFGWVYYIITNCRPIRRPQGRPLARTDPALQPLCPVMPESKQDRRYNNNHFGKLGQQIAHRTEGQYRKHCCGLILRRKRCWPPDATAQASKPAAPLNKRQLQTQSGGHENSATTKSDPPASGKPRARQAPNAQRKQGRAVRMGKQERTEKHRLLGTAPVPVAPPSEGVSRRAAG